MGYSVILFDLDGTLTDSAPGITNAAAYALERLSIPVPPRPELLQFVGPPLTDSFRALYGMDEGETQEAIAAFRAYYNARGVLENSPYPGVHAFLASLKAAGKTLAVATSKPQHLADEVLERYELAQYFTAICGGSLDERRNVKALIVADALSACGATDKRRALMVGDRRHDIEGAKANGLAAMGVLYGYGSRAELERAGADYICAGFGEMGRVILG